MVAVAGYLAGLFKVLQASGVELVEPGADHLHGLSVEVGIDPELSELPVAVPVLGSAEPAVLPVDFMSFGVDQIGQNSKEPAPEAGEALSLSCSEKHHHCRVHDVGDTPSRRRIESQLERESKGISLQVASPFPPNLSSLYTLKLKVYIMVNIFSFRLIFPFF